MPHINHRRGETRSSVNEYPWDKRAWKIPSWRPFRSRESFLVKRLHQGDDPDTLVFPSHIRHVEDGWYYD